MDLIELVKLVLVLAVIGFLVHLITSRIPMDSTIKMAIQIIVVIVVVLWLLSRFSASLSL